jgi:hypothetical protein
MAQLKQAEVALVQKEKTDHLEKLTKSRAQELIQIGQDKS